MKTKQAKQQVPAGGYIGWSACEFSDEFSCSGIRVIHKSVEVPLLTVFFSNKLRGKLSLFPQRFCYVP